MNNDEQYAKIWLNTTRSDQTSTEHVQTGTAEEPISKFDWALFLSWQCFVRR